jgi:hypothetical protein
MFTKRDVQFLKVIGISTATEPLTDAAFLRAVGIAADPEPGPAPHEWDETCDWLREAGAPVTAESWMNLQFAGNPPAIGEVDGEILAELPRWVRAVYDPDYEANRIPYGAESRYGSDEPAPPECPECQTDFGMLHVPGCEIEEED